MKKLVTLYSFIVMLALLLSACGGATATPASVQTEEPAATEPAATEAGATEPAATEPAATEAAAATATPAPELLGSGDTKIVIWHRWEGEYYKAIQQIFADYAEQNNVQIELLLVQDVANRAQLAIPAGQGPDIIAWVNDRLGDSALSEIIQPLDDYGVDEAYLRENFAPVAVEAMLYNGQVYGIPESLEAMTFIYNKALISEAELPQSTDDLIAAAQTFNQPPEKYLFVYNAQGDIYASAAWFQGMGVQLVKPDGTTDIGNEDSVKGAQLIQSFSEIMPKELDYGTADALFKDGKAAIIFNGPWSIADYQAAGIDIGLAPIPTLSASGQPGAPFVGVKLLMLAANAQNPEAAVELMKHYGSAEVQAELARVNKQVPANLEAQEQVKDDPTIAAFIAQAANGRPMPSTEFIAAMWTPFNSMVTAIWTGAATPEQAVQDGATLFEEAVVDLK